jgi:hypothetical protein
MATGSLGEMESSLILAEKGEGGVVLVDNRICGQK